MTIKYFFSRLLLLCMLMFVPLIGFAQTHIITREPAQMPKKEQKAKPRQKRNDQKPRRNANGSAQPTPVAPRPLEQLKRAQLKAFADETITVNGESFVMKAVKGGTFTMGSDATENEQPAHRVTVSDFHIGQTEVTQALWQAVMGDNPSWYYAGDSRPADKVSWDDCQTFISRLNALTGRHFRLPTEAEWEYAARGGNRSQGFQYAGSNDLDAVAWYWDNSSQTTHNVATKTPNELGLYDMNGNVWEWCQDWFGRYSADAQTNPVGPASGTDRVCRGGSWNFTAEYFGVSRRRSCSPSLHVNMGLRLAL